MPQKISELMLEQYNLGELSDAQERLVRDELVRDEDLRARLDAIRDSDRQIAADYPAEQVVPRITERAVHQSMTMERERRGVPRLVWAIPVAAMALVLVTFSVLSGLPQETRLKGLTPHISVFRKTATGAEELSQGMATRQGDVLQVSYSAGTARYGVIFSIDGRGSITWHLPPQYGGGSRTAAPLETHSAVVLPLAYELDDAPGFERFFFVYGTASFSIADVEKAARTLAAQPVMAENASLTLPRGLGQSSLLVKK